MSKYSVNIAWNVARPVTLLVGLVLGTLAQATPAGQPDCRTVENIGERLACYDAAFPPIVKKPAPIENGAAHRAYNDPFLAEEAKTAAKLKNICRGC